MVAVTAGLPVSPTMGVPQRLVFTLVPLALLVGTAWLGLVDGLPFAGRIDWVPALGVSLAWRVDGLSFLMLLMISGIGTAVFVYAGAYMAGHPHQRRLFVLLTVFTLAMVGCVTADDVIALFVFWELTSVTSFLLVGLDHARADSRRSAQQALLVTGTGGLALLAGLLVLSQALGTTSLSQIVSMLATQPPTPELAAALALILMGAFTKSAQVPFHFWLPNAMSAPTPVSAFLHSATMVKLGVYLLARLDPGFGHWAAWPAVLVVVGSVTAAWGMVLALRERDLKRILAWSTVATLGTLVMLVGLPGESAAVAVGAMLLAHALYKAPLFFVAGNIDHAVGTRVIDRLGGLRRAMPWTAVAALLAGLSMAGIPATFGFVAKDVIASAKTAGGENLLITAAQAGYAVFGAIAVAVAGVAAVRVFWRRPGVSEACETAHEGGPSMVGPPLVLAGLGIVLGLFPVLAETLVTAASDAMTPETLAMVVNLTPALAPVLGSLALTLAAGVGIYLGWDPLHRAVDRVVTAARGLGAAAFYDRSLGWLPWLAARSTRALQHGRLPGYAATLVGACTLAVAAVLATGPALPWPAPQLPTLGVAGACALVAAGATGAVVARQRLVMLLSAGLVGYGSALLFLFTGAPDLAFTQFAVETVFVIVVACVLIALARRRRDTSASERSWRPLHALVAAGFATVVTVLLLAVAATPLDDTVSRWFAERSVPDANGRNVVNVILVDFRALDTLGEIAVVLLSMLAAMPLLQALRDARGTTRGSS